MKVAFDGRVLKHSHFTGVEIYADMIYKALSKNTDVRLIMPVSSNTYLQHIWEHLVLPLQTMGSHLLFCPANIAPLWIPRKIKLVVTLHDIAYLTHHKSVSKVFGAYYRWLIPKILKRANAVITISEASKREIARYYPFAESKTHVIYNGIGENFSPIDFHTKTKTILYVGSLHERKNFISVIQAFQQIQNEIDDYRLIVIGKFSDIFNLTPETQKIINDAKQNPKIVFLDSVSMKDIQRYYAQAALFLFPSFYEGFGFPPLEAMASGTPVITSNLSSMPEICGGAALYVDPYDIDDIVVKVKNLLGNTVLQKEMIDKGLKQAKKFKWEYTAQEYKNIFEKVLI